MIYSIGHSNHNIEKFIFLLKLHDINCICDVRSSPFSKFVTHFNRDKLKESLNSNNIKYIFMGEEFGARRKEKTLYTGDMVDFDKVADSPIFNDGLQRINNGILKGFKIALMCSEKNPIECHRTILVSRFIQKNGQEVQHILEDGSLKSQSAIEEDLLNKYFPDRFQISFFDTTDEDEKLNLCYKKANEEVAYRDEDMNENIHYRVY